MEGEDRFATLEYDPSLDAVVGMAHEYAAGEAFRTVLDDVVELVRDHDCAAFLADTRELGPIADDDQVWLVEEWSPRAQAAGVERIAFVLPESAVASMSLDRVMEQVQEDDIDRRFFEDPDHARDWLAGEA
jgi:hypothetical protein